MRVFYKNIFFSGGLERLYLDSLDDWLNLRKLRLPNDYFDFLKNVNGGKPEPSVLLSVENKISIDFIRGFSNKRTYNNRNKSFQFSFRSKVNDNYYDGFFLPSDFSAPKQYIIIGNGFQQQNEILILMSLEEHNYGKIFISKLGQRFEKKNNLNLADNNALEVICNSFDMLLFEISRYYKLPQFLRVFLENPNSNSFRLLDKLHSKSFNHGEQETCHLFSAYSSLQHSQGFQKSYLDYFLRRGCKAI